MKRAVKLLVSLLVGAAVCALMLRSARLITGQNLLLRPRHAATFYVFNSIECAIGEYTRQHAAPPADLSLLPKDAIAETGIAGAPDELAGPVPGRGVVDGWGRPVIYETNGRTWRLASFGRDGRPGGEGLDADIDSDAKTLSGAHDWYAYETPITWRQFFREVPGTHGMINAALVGGAIGFALCLLAVWRIDLSRWGPLKLFIAVYITAMAAWFVTSIMMALHIPSGH